MRFKGIGVWGLMFYFSSLAGAANYECTFQKRLFNPSGIGVAEEEKAVEVLPLSRSQRVKAILNGYTMVVNTCNEEPADEIDVTFYHPDGRPTASSISHAGQTDFGLFLDALSNGQTLELSVYCTLKP